MIAMAMAAAITMAMAPQAGEEAGSRDGEAWVLPATAPRAVDGDTVDVTAALPWGFERRIRLRLAGLDTAETRDRDPELRAHGKDAAAYAAEWLASCEALLAMVFGEDRYGRSLGDVECAADGRRLGADLLEERLAVRYDGGNRGLLEPAHRANAAWRRDR